jgi:hypothetical protein
MFLYRTTLNAEYRPGNGDPTGPEQSAKGHMQREEELRWGGQRMRRRTKRNEGETSAGTVESKRGRFEEREDCNPGENEAF